MIRDVTDFAAGEPVGGLFWLRVQLTEDLLPADHAEARVTVPKTPAGSGPFIDSDYWQDGGITLPEVYNGLPSATSIISGKICWVHFYLGRWVVLIPEC